jgi:hypothetical protein
MVLPSLQAVQQQQQPHAGPGRPSPLGGGRASRSAGGSRGKVRQPSRLARSVSSPSSSSTSSSSSSSSTAHSPAGKSSSSRQQPSRLRQVQSLSPPSQHLQYQQQQHQQRPIAITKQSPPLQLPSLSSLVASLPMSLPATSHLSLQHVP